MEKKPISFFYVLLDYSLFILFSIPLELMQ